MALLLTTQVPTRGRIMLRFEAFDDSGKGGEPVAGKRIGYGEVDVSHLIGKRQSEQEMTVELVEAEGKRGRSPIQ